MHCFHRAFHVSTQANHHENRVLFSTMAEDLPRKIGISEKLSPRVIVVRTNLDFKNTAS